jgi:hypothetical protein
MLSETAACVRADRQAGRQAGIVLILRVARVCAGTKNDSDQFLAEFGSMLFGKLQPKHMQREWHHKLHASDKIELFPPSLIMLYREHLQYFL